MVEHDEMTVGQVAAFLGVAESTVRRSTTLRPYRLVGERRDRRYKRADVLAELERMRAAADPESPAR